jgi:hypothetical protein
MMARFNCLPHLIVVFGRAIWENHWRTLHPNEKRAGDHFEVLSYRPAGATNSAVRHHANRVVVEYEHGRHVLLLACLHHPSARAKRGSRRDAAWLLNQQEFCECVYDKDAG